MRLRVAAGMIVITLALLVTSMPAAAAGADVQHYRFSGQYAYAYFHSSDGCVRTSFYLNVTDGRFQAEGSPEITRAASIAVVTFNDCTFEFLSLATGEAALSGRDFRLDHNLDTAVLDTTVQVSDWSTGASYDVDVSVTWTGVGDLFEGKFVSQSSYGNFRYVSQWMGAWRNASATGSISTDAISLSNVSVDYVGMGWSRSGSITISRSTY